MCVFSCNHGHACACAIPHLPCLKGLRVNHCGLDDLLPWEHAPCDSDWLEGVTVGVVICSLELEWRGRYNKLIQKRNKTDAWLPKPESGESDALGRIPKLLGGFNA